MAEGQLKRELVGVVLLVFALFLAATILVGGGSPLAGADAQGLMGPVGSWLRHAMLSLLGLPATLLLPLVPAVHALRLFGRMRSDTDRSWMLFLAGLVVLVPIACGLGVEQGARSVSFADGLWGSFVAYYLHAFFGPVGAWLVVSMLLCALTVLTLAWNPIRVLIGVRVQHVQVFEPVAANAPAKGRKKRKGVEAVEVPAALLEPPPEEMPQIEPALMHDGGADSQEDGAKGRKRKKSRAELSVEHDERIAAAIDATDEGSLGDDELPPPELLTPAEPRNVELGKKDLDAMGVKLVDALRTFRVEAEITGRTTGPVVTQFEVEPAPGVKVRQIANLSNDLALAMRAASIRIVAPIPGRGAVGVEVPNPTSEIVAFRELIESSEFKTRVAALPIALGKDLEGKPVIADLAKMPHLLIAGATGSGKSVCVNTIITSLIYKHTPKTLRFLMVDPKMVELSVYNTLPHLRHKVITDSRDAASVLKWAEMEMQERYELLAANGCRNIQDFNRRLKNGEKLKVPKQKNVAFESTEYTGKHLPYIVVVIDELADLMMTVQGEVEPPLARLAQKARAIGIHLLLATQRPSVNVITGLIKANFPSRIAFRVASQVDSRTIIDGMGAESLLGNGDMLFIPPGKSEAARLQGAYISSEDTEELMKWYEAQKEKRKQVFESQGLIVEEPVAYESDILEEMRKREAASTGDAADAEIAGERDKLFREAAEVVVQNQLGSTSLLQRRLKVGYGRAARIIDQLQEAGILGPADGSKARDVLVGLDDIDRICGPAS
ncbi:MAG TPA: DNA translocase FtsK 4TM domain-containing protein [Gemmatimonadaceae bacterium]